MKKRITSHDLSILDGATEAFKRTMQNDADIRQIPICQNQADHAILELTTNKCRYRFRALVKAVDRFETPALVKAQGELMREPPLLVAPHITPEMAERCRKLHLPFIDTAGNVYLEAQGLFVYVTGNKRPVDFRRTRFRALNPAGLQIAFALACHPDLAKTRYREIAARAGVALGTIGPVMEDLENRGYLGFKNNSGRKLIDGKGMVEEWVTHYPSALRQKLNPRRFRADIKRLQQANLMHQNAYWGGESAAERLTRYLKPDHFTIYTREPIAKLVAAGRMHADPAGNVEILDAFWHFGRDKEFPDIVPPILAYADLLATHEGRNVEAARMIYEQRIAPTFSPDNEAS